MMRILEFLEMVALVLLIPFAVFVIAPFGLAQLAGQISRLLGASL